MDVNNPGLVDVADQAFPPDTFSHAPVGPAAETVDANAELLVQEIVNPLAESALVPEDVEPATQGQALIAVSASFPDIGPDVNPQEAAEPPVNDNSWDVTAAGSFPVSPQNAIASGIIQAIVDPDTGAFPTASSIYVQFTLGLVVPLDSYGVELTGRQLFFTSGAWAALLEVAYRIIVRWGSNIIIIANQDQNGNPLPWPPAPGPVPGNTVAFDTSRQGSEEVSNVIAGGVQDVTPKTNPLLPPPGTPAFPAVEVNVSSQAPLPGLPINVFI